MTSPKNHSSPATAQKSTLRPEEVILRRLLKASPQDLWLDTIRRTRGDKHDGLVFWMLNQTECDFAIAVHAFYRCKPVQMLETPKPLSARPSQTDIFGCVLLNWDTGSYRSHSLMVQAADAAPRDIERLNQKLMVWPPGSLPFTIPPRFLNPEGGRVLNIPSHMSPDDARHVWPLYSAFGLRVPEAAPGVRRQFLRAKILLNKINIKRRGL